METAMKIRRMVLVDQRSIRSVSKETGLSRNTVRKYVRDESAPSYDRSQPAPRHNDYHSALYRDVKVTHAGESHMGSLGVTWQTKHHQWHWVIQEDLLVGSAADVSFQVGYERIF